MQHHQSFHFEELYPAVGRFLLQQMDSLFRLFQSLGYLQQCLILAVAFCDAFYDDGDVFSYFLLLFCALVTMAVGALDLALTKNKKNQLLQS